MVPVSLAGAAVARSLSPAMEIVRDDGAPSDQGVALGPSRPIVLRLAGLFAVDSFAGGFTVGALIAYWFAYRFDTSTATLGLVFAVVGVLQALSFLAAGRLADRFGLLTTMVATHLPSNLLLAAVPLAPTLPVAIALLLARFSISQMDVPTRQSYTMAVVDPGERAAAAGVTGIARTIGAALAPLAAGPLYASAALASVPFFVSGGLKIAYDLLLWRAFRAHRPPEEGGAG
jgi:predicted MFS family arabinose efflux permease